MDYFHCHCNDPHALEPVDGNQEMSEDIFGHIAQLTYQVHNRALFHSPTSSAGASSFMVLIKPHTRAVPMVEF